MKRTQAKPAYLRYVIGIAVGVALPIGAIFFVKLWLDYRTPPAELLGPSPEVLRLIRMNNLAAARGLRLSASARNKLSVARIATADDYYAYYLKTTPGDPTLEAYLKIAGQMNDKALLERMKELFYAPARYRIIWKPNETLPPPQCEWLHSHHALLEDIDRLAQTSGTLAIAGDELMFLAGQKRLPVAVSLQFLNYDLHWDLAMLLAAAWRLELQEGRPREAQRCALNLLALSDKYQNSFNPYIQAFLQGNAAWIGDPALPPADWAALREGLDRSSRARSPREERIQNCALDYLFWRGYYIREFEYPELQERGKTSPESGYLAVGAYTLPRPGFMNQINNSIGRMYYRINLPHWLAGYDRKWKTVFERMRLSWAKASRMPPIGESHNILENPNPDAAAVLHNFLQLETQTNLNRAALEVMTRSAAPPSTAADLKKDPGSPWRDPFTEQPLRTTRETSRTLIYSLGPDLADQHGQITYDPTNGTTSTGDIIIKLK